ncbi:MAG: radical SAM protein [Candidatus Hydrogenedentes bacterium]|nr:radical SAM protein [Candidatus Hydrogenedentota bacterium]
MLSDVRCVLINPYLEPTDLRGELQSIDGDKTHESALNYGLLVVASTLVNHGAQVEIVDLERNEEDWKTQLDSAVARTDPQWIGIGTLSVYSFLPTREILRHCRQCYPGVVTVVGGQNAQNVPRLLDRVGERHLLDYALCGDGERAVRELANAIMSNREPHFQGINAVPNGEINIQFADRVPLEGDSTFLHYDLYPDFRHLWPVVEESRGCPYRCDFCANVLQGGAGIKYKDPALLVRELRRVFDVYGDEGEMPVVLMTSIFGVNPQLTKEFFTMLAAESIRPQFVASTRVDLNFDAYIDLVPRYFDQMHFGLETGATQMVGLMQKAKRPEHYLRRAEQTLAAWHRRGVHTAVNFIAGYLGETSETLEESIAFLECNRQNIDSAWGGALIAYPDSPFARRFQEVKDEFGARLEVVSDYCDLLQTYPVSPSGSLSYSDVLGYVDKVHDIFYDSARYYHHYKWYVGPRRDQDIPAFVTRDEFEYRFHITRPEHA